MQASAPAHGRASHLSRSVVVPCREAETLFVGALELGYGPHEAEAVLEHAQGDGERALEELQARRAMQVSFRRGPRWPPGGCCGEGVLQCVPDVLWAPFV